MDPYLDDLPKPNPIPGVSILIIGLAVLTAVIRVYIGYTTTPGPMTWVEVYKDLAHMFIASLLTCLYLNKSRLLLWVCLALIVVEVSVATFSRL